jgi:hypothetical protein
VAGDFEKPYRSGPPPRLPSEDGGVYESLVNLIKDFREEVGFLRTDRNELAVALKSRDAQIDLLKGMIESQNQQINHLVLTSEQRERQWTDERQQWTDERQQWTDERQQWASERQQFALQINTLEKKVQDLGMSLKQSMKIIPSTEKGSSLIPVTKTSGNDDDGDGGAPPPPNLPGQPQGPSNHEKKYLDTCDGYRDPDGFRESKLKSRQDWWKSIGSDKTLIPAPALIFRSPLYVQRETEETFAFTPEERRDLKKDSKGFSSKYDQTVVYDFETALVKRICRNETLSNPITGEYYRKKNNLGPSGTNISWNAVADICTRIAEYATPMDRLAKGINHPYFTSSQISRIFIRTAVDLVGIYVAGGLGLSKASYLNIDDTYTLVLSMRDEAERGLVADKDKGQKEGQEKDKAKEAIKADKKKVSLFEQVYENFGRVSQRADDKGPKKGVNVSVIRGRLSKRDSRSTFYFYRTHFGQAGNLLSRIFENRSSSDKSLVVIQGDLSSQNHIEKQVAQFINFIYIGCMPHARRPFFKHRKADTDLAFCLLRCFALIAHIEAKIKNGPLTAERILRYRQRYASKVWTLIKELATAVVNLGPHPLVPLKNLWKKDDDLYDACLYILKFYKELTYYLNDPNLSCDNNISEQALRGERLIENGSYFRKSENGRIALDIHRSFIASCNACGLPYNQYLRYLGAQEPAKIAKNPAKYLPHKVARLLNRGQGPPPSKTNN